MFKRILFVIIFLFFASTSILANQITWHVSISGEEMSGDIITETLDEGISFIIPSRVELPQTLSLYQDLFDALAGISINIPAGSFSRDVDVKLSFGPYSPGLGFPNIGMVRIFFIVDITVIIEGNSENEFELNPGNQMTFMIPGGSGLNFLLNYAGLNESSDLLFAFRNNGSFTFKGISTKFNSQGIKVTTRKLARIYGGEQNDISVASGIQFKTWQQIKLLFR